MTTDSNIRLKASIILIIGLTAACTCVEAQVVTLQDGIFDSTDWDLVVSVRNPVGGSASATQESTGGNPDAYRSITINLNDAIPFPGNIAFVSAVSINHSLSYNPMLQGAIHSIDYSEDAINITGTGQGQAATLAIRQNDQIYIAYAKRVFTPETVFTEKQILDLTEADFQGLTDANARPDFSVNGGEIEFGFLRANSGLDDSPASSRTTGIDNWNVILVPTLSGRAGTSLQRNVGDKLDAARNSASGELKSAIDEIDVQSDANVQQDALEQVAPTGLAAQTQAIQSTQQQQADIALGRMDKLNDCSCGNEGANNFLASSFDNSHQIYFSQPITIYQNDSAPSKMVKSISSMGEQSSQSRFLPLLRSGRWTGFFGSNYSFAENKATNNQNGSQMDEFTLHWVVTI